MAVGSGPWQWAAGHKCGLCLKGTKQTITPTFVRKQQSSPAELVPTSSPVVSLAMSRIKEGKCRAQPLLCELLSHSIQNIDSIPSVTAFPRLLLEPVRFSSIVTWVPKYP